jgi:RND superfamily putative drug exporter
MYAPMKQAMAARAPTVVTRNTDLAGIFTVLAVAGNSSQSRQLGFPIAVAILLDTFCVRTLLVPSIAVLLGRANWWPSRLVRGPIATAANEAMRDPD